jgi:hypothetical protein
MPGCRALLNTGAPHIEPLQRSPLEHGACVRHVIRLLQDVSVVLDNLRAGQPP